MDQAKKPAKKSKKGPVTARELEEALALESELFGTKTTLTVPVAVAAGPGAEEDVDSDAEDEEMPLFFEDREGDALDNEDEDRAASDKDEDEDDEPAAQGRAEQEEEAGPSGRGAQPQSHKQPADGKKRRAPAWEDDNDGGQLVDVVKKKTLRKLRKKEDESALTAAEFEERLREQHRKLHPGTGKWAQLKGKAARGGAGSDSDDEEAEGAERRLTQSFGQALRKGSKMLPPTYLETTRVRDANQHEPSHAVIQSTRFHPTRGDVLLTAGLDKKLRLFQVDGVRNAKLQSVHFADMPIHDAQFVKQGAQVMCTGRRKFFYIYDVTRGNVERIQGVFGRDEKSFESFVPQNAPSADPLVAFVGNEGCVPLVSLNSRLPVATLKMPGSVRCAAFTGDGNGLWAIGSDGVLHQFDLRTHRCLSRVVDEGATKPTSLACSPEGSWVATGSDMGVVNVYKGAKMPTIPAPVPGAPARPLAPSVVAPEKAIMNLVTQVDTMTFSSDGQMLAIASRMQRDAMRIVHLPSMTVFQNWPTSRTPLGHVHTLDFSPKCGFLAIGNAQGKVLLYRLHHYAQA